MPRLIRELAERDKNSVTPPPPGWPQVELDLWVRMKPEQRRELIQRDWDPGKVRRFADSLSRLQAERRAKREAARRGL
ncbi:MAG: hypothetical protein J2P50_15470 [Hyphomicrobiaceae bacterium]|nr:hypothetical protein [Hyphomicrobiaceae bacterium]